MSMNYKTPYQLPKEVLVSLWNRCFGKRFTWTYLFEHSEKMYASQVKSDLANEIKHYVRSKGYKGEYRYGEMYHFVNSVKVAEWKAKRPEKKAIDDIMNIGFQEPIGRSHTHIHMSKKSKRSVFMNKLRDELNQQKLMTDYLRKENDELVSVGGKRMSYHEYSL